MISAKGLIYGDKKTEELCFVPENHSGLYGLQLFCSEPEVIKAAILKIFKILEMGQLPDFFDINMGCPVPKVVGTGAGAALLKTPETAAALTEAAVSAANTAGIPVTVKIRTGWDDNSINAVPFAKMLEDAGAAAITIHGRTKIQGFSGDVSYDIIKQVKDSVKIPVIGNGGVDSPARAAQMFRETGVDSIMIGVGSYGRPWIFSQINEYIKSGGEVPEPTFSEKIDIMTAQVKLAVQYKGEAAAMREARTQCALYLKGFPGAAALREKCSHLKTLEDYYKLIEGL
jgi:nifR3 family TIM-barrel protein